MVCAMTSDWKKTAEDAWSAESWKVAAKEVSRSEPISPDQEYQGNASADQSMIEALAQLDMLAYQKRRLEEATTLGVPVAALDKLVRHAQARAEDKDAELAALGRAC
jgi:hypothetical protein